MDAVKRNDEEFLATARKRFQQAHDDEKALRDEALKDLRFVAGDQWDDALKQKRIAAGRPALTFSRCHTFVQQVSNEARQNKPQIVFVPAEDGDKETAKVYEGLARHIQYSSDAQVAYETAVEYSAGGSFGYYRLLTDYVDDKSFDQELKIVPVLDPFAVYGILMPACYGMEPKFAFITSDLAKDEFKALYPKAKVTGDWDGEAEASSGWVRTEMIRLAEYWYIEEESQEITHPTDASKKRTVTSKVVKWCKTNGVEILEETEWPGKSIPIIPVLGKQLIVDGKPQLFSVIRFQRDPQQMINYYKSRIAETLQTAPVSPYLAAEGQLEGHEREWAESNSRVLPFLTYKPSTVDGKLVGAPQRQTFEPPIGALSSAAAQEIDDMKATAGIYDASLGARGNESSGIAIQRRQQQSNITNMHFMDNLERAFKKGGRMLAEVMPSVYDTPRIVRILGEDEKPKLVKINQETQGETGQPAQYTFGPDAPKFDIIVTMGRAFSTKRMETSDAIVQLVQANPQVFPMLADIYFANSDIAGADVLADRFKKGLPPQFQEDKGPQQVPPQVQQQMQQQGQMIEQLTQHLNAASETISTKRLELETRLQIAQLQAEAQIKIAAMKAMSTEETAAFQAEMDHTHALMSRIDALESSLNPQQEMTNGQEDGSTQEAGPNANEAQEEGVLTPPNFTQDQQAEQPQQY